MLQVPLKCVANMLAYATDGRSANLTFSMASAGVGADPDVEVAIRRVMTYGRNMRRKMKLLYVPRQPSTGNQTARAPASQQVAWRTTKSEEKDGIQERM